MERVDAIAVGKTAVWRVGLVMLAVLLFAGCSSHAVKPKTAGYSQLMQQAQTSQSVGNLEDAKKYYNEAASVDPTQGAPWYQMARIEFSQQNYGLSIVDAREAIRRNPDNTEAQSILTVSGLRVAVQALGSLHDETDPEGPAHQEAMQLAAKMRHVLGQQVLVPPAATTDETARRAHAQRTHRRVHRRSAPRQHAAPKTEAKAAPTKTYSNPFEALPGNGG